MGTAKEIQGAEAVGEENGARAENRGMGAVGEAGEWGPRGELRRGCRVEREGNGGRVERGSTDLVHEADEVDELIALDVLFRELRLVHHAHNVRKAKVQCSRKCGCTVRYKSEKSAVQQTVLRSQMHLGKYGASNSGSGSIRYCGSRGHSVASA